MAMLAQKNSESYSPEIKTLVERDVFVKELNLFEYEQYGTKQELVEEKTL
jgi:hypothetical protein